MLSKSSAAAAAAAAARCFFLLKTLAKGTYYEYVIDVVQISQKGSGYEYEYGQRWVAVVVSAVTWGAPTKEYAYPSVLHYAWQIYYCRY